VTFTLAGDTTALCTATLSAGRGSCTTSALSLGQDSVTATYGGDGTHAGSIGSVDVTVLPPSTITLSAPQIVQAGQSVTLSANVGGNFPTGTVTFSSGATVLCSNVPLYGGTATCNPTVLLLTGKNTITATYSGDKANAPGSASATVDVVPPTMSCGDYWYNQPFSPFTPWTNCESLLSTSYNQYQYPFANVATPGTTVTATYSDETSLLTSGTSAPTAVVLSARGVPVETLPVKISHATKTTLPGGGSSSGDGDGDGDGSSGYEGDGNGFGSGYHDGYGDGNGDNDGPTRYSAQLTISVPATLPAGDTIELTVADSDQNVDQISWQVSSSGDGDHDNDGNQGNQGNQGNDGKDGKQSNTTSDNTQSTVKSKAQRATHG
jgi:hypothetical protein